MTETPSAGQLLLVGAYADPAQPGIVGLRLDQTTGALSACGSIAGIANPSFLVVHPNGRWVYAVSETGAIGGASGAVWALRLDQQPFALTLLNSQSSAGAWPCHLQLDATGGWLLVSNYGDGVVGVLPLLPDGSLGPMAAMHRHQGRSANPERQEGAHAHSTIMSPDNRFAIVADLGIDRLMVYAFDPATGALDPRAPGVARPGAGPRHMAFHPSGRILYVANELDNTVSVYDYDPASAALREIQTLSTLPADAPESAVADIHLDAAGQRLYVSNRGHNSLAVFAVDPAGGLALLATPPCGGTWPRNFALAPGGQHALVANQHSGSLDLLPLDETRGAGPAITSVAIPQASCVQFVAE